MVFGVKRFHQYLYGGNFIMITDDKPMTILGSKKGIPSARLQCWAIILGANDYNVTLKRTLEHSNADAWSRIPLPNQMISYSSVASMFNIHQIEAFPVTAIGLQQGTRKDASLTPSQYYNTCFDFLLTYQTTPHSTTRATPCSLF